MRRRRRFKKLSIFSHGKITLSNNSIKLMLKSKLSSKKCSRHNGLKSKPLTKKLNAKNSFLIASETSNLSTITQLKENSDKFKSIQTRCGIKNYLMPISIESRQ